MNIRPFNHRIVVERIDDNPHAPFIIDMPDSAKEKPTRGKVLAVGPGKRNKQGERVPLDVKIGDVVHFGNRFIDFERDNLVMIQEGDIRVVEC